MNKVIKDYINTIPDVARKPIESVIACIIKAAPNAQPKINYGILAFSLIPNGKREEQVMVAGYQRHIGFYPHPTTIEHFFNELKEFKHAKGSVQFPVDKSIPEELIINMVIYRQNQLKNRQN